MPEITRRGLLAALVTAPLAVAADRLVQGIERGAPLFRPAASGSSAGRCGRCGAADHTMLSASCAAAPPVSRSRR